MATIGSRYVMEIEKTGVEIETSSLNITFAKAVPNKERMNMYPKEVLTSEATPTSDQGKSTNKRTPMAGKMIDIKFPKAIAIAGTPWSLYLIKFTLIE